MSKAKMYEIAPETNTKYIVLSSAEELEYRDYKEKLEVKLLYLTPTSWDLWDRDDIQHYLCRQFRSWLQTYDFDPETVISEHGVDLWGLAGIALYLTPERWRKQFFRDQNSVAGRKMVTMMKYRFLFDIWEELFKGLVGNARFSEYAHSLADIVEQIMLQKFETSQEMFVYIDKSQNLFAEPKFRSTLLLHWTLGFELRGFYGIQTKDYEFFTAEHRNVYAYLSKWGKDGTTLLPSFEETKAARVRTTGALAWIEYLLLLDQLQLSPEIWTDKYWERLRYLYSVHYALSHDIVNIEEDVKYGHSQNIICSQVRSGKNLSDVVQSTVEHYNEILTELDHVVLRLKEKRYMPEEDRAALYRPPIAPELKAPYYDSFKLIRNVSAGVWQALVVEKEWGLDFNFEGGRYYEEQPELDRMETKIV